MYILLTLDGVVVDSNDLEDFVSHLSVIPKPPVVNTLVSLFFIRKHIDCLLLK